MYEVDSGSILEIAKETLARAGLGSQAVFIRGKASQIELPQRVDLVVCDHIGCFGFDYGIIGLLQDARNRFLKPEGVLVPARLNLQLSLIESERCASVVQGWATSQIPAEYHWLAEHEKHTKHLVNLKSEELLSEPGLLGCINLYENTPDYFSWSVDLITEREGVMHGLGGWCETCLAEGVWVSNSPLTEKSIKRSQVFLPVGEPVPVKSGEHVKATIMTRPADNLIAWVVELPTTGQRFKHSTWQTLLTDTDFIRAAPNHIPRLKPEGHARITIMSYCDGRRTFHEVEQAILRDHPHLLPSSEEISRFVAEVLGRNTE